MLLDFTSNQPIFFILSV